MVKLTSNFNWLDLLIRSIPFLMGIFIFFNPFPHTTAIKEICYYLSVIIVTILILSKDIDFTFKTPLLLPFGLFILWSFLSVFFAFILALNHLRNDNHLYLRVFLVFSLLVLFIGLLLTQTRSSLLAIFLAVIIFFYKNKKWMFVFLILMLMISAISPIKSRLQSFNPKKIYINIQKDVRIKMNHLTLEVIKEHPVIGIGFGLQTYGKLDLERYQKRIPKKYQQEKIITDPHNMVLDITARLGVVGLVLFFYIIFVFLKMCWDIIKYGKNDFEKNWGRCLFAAFFSFLLIGFFHPVFSHMPETILCVMFSMLTIVWRFNNELISKDII